MFSLNLMLRLHFLGFKFASGHFCLSVIESWSLRYSCSKYHSITSRTSWTVSMPEKITSTGTPGSSLDLLPDMTTEPTGGIRITFLKESTKKQQLDLRTPHRISMTVPGCPTDEVHFNLFYKISFIAFIPSHFCHDSHLSTNIANACSFIDMFMGNNGTSLLQWNDSYQTLSLSK